MAFQLTQEVSSSQQLFGQKVPSASQIGIKTSLLPSWIMILTNVYFQVLPQKICLWQILQLFPCSGLGGGCAVLLQGETKPILDRGSKLNVSQWVIGTVSTFALPLYRGSYFLLNSHEFPHFQQPQWGRSAIHMVCREWGLKQKGASTTDVLKK